ncbi:MAG: rhamnulokinase [Lachnospiraceae bacterium]|nr:rhamnulokinase [Lachnospiraceae bacterium]
MQEYFLAIDIGASSGRHILGCLKNGRIELEEVHRFPNRMEEKDGHLVWNVDALFAEIILGMKKCKEIGKVPCSVGIDTWGVDFVLLDKEDKRIGDAIAYRDSRTVGMDKLVYQAISEDTLYIRTGIQKQIFNTIYQLMAVKEQNPNQLQEAKTMLMIPDYFHFRLTGKKVQEYTNATTTQLVNPERKNWDYELIERLGYPSEIFGEITKPGTYIGNLAKDIQMKVGYDCRVVLPATHDTASAVMAVPSNKKNTLYISSGTWSLIGTERMEADCRRGSMRHNFTNEGGYDYRFRYLKNIMGLWMIQSVKKELAPEMNFGEICKLAASCKMSSLVDVNDQRFLAPASMVKEIQLACKETGEEVPQTIEEIAAVVYNSLAVCYSQAVKEIETLTGNIYNSIHIVGGGANAKYLNEQTAKKAERTVYAGPTEATAIGNLLAQMIAAGKIKNLQDARDCVFDSFEIQVYK